MSFVQESDKVKEEQPEEVKKESESFIPYEKKEETDIPNAGREPIFN